MRFSVRTVDRSTIYQYLNCVTAGPHNERVGDMIYSYGVLSGGLETVVRLVPHRLELLRKLYWSAKWCKYYNVVTSDTITRAIIP